MITIMKRDKVGAALSTAAEIRALTSAQRHKHWIIYKHLCSTGFRERCAYRAGKTIYRMGQKDGPGQLSTWILGSNRIAV